MTTRQLFEKAIEGLPVHGGEPVEDWLKAREIDGEFLYEFLRSVFADTMMEIESVQSNHAGRAVLIGATSYTFQVGYEMAYVKSLEMLKRDLGLEE